MPCYVVITGLDVTTQPIDVLLTLTANGIPVSDLEVKFGCSSQSEGIRATAAVPITLQPGIKLRFKLVHSVPAPTDGGARTITVEAATKHAKVSPALPPRHTLRLRITAHRRGTLDTVVRPTRKFLAVVLERLWSGSAQLLNVVSDDIPKKKGRVQVNPANIVSGFFAEATSEEAAAAIVQRCHGRRLVLLGQPFLLLAEFTRPGKSGACYDKQAERYEGCLRENMMAEWAAAATEAEDLYGCDDDVCEFDQSWFVRGDQPKPRPTVLPDKVRDIMPRDKLDVLVNEPIAPEILSTLGLSEYISRFEEEEILTYLDLCSALPQQPGDDDLLQKIVGRDAWMIVRFMKMVVQQWPAARQYHEINPAPANQVLAAAAEYEQTHALE